MRAIILLILAASITAGAAEEYVRVVIDGKTYEGWRHSQTGVMRKHGEPWTVILEVRFNNVNESEYIKPPTAEKPPGWQEPKPKKLGPTKYGR